MPSARIRHAFLHLAISAGSSLVVYAAAHLAHRSTAISLRELTTSINHLTNRVRVDYWRVYSDVQRDLLLGEEDGN